MKKIKSFLKKILPLPATSVQREIDILKYQNDQLNKQLMKLQEAHEKQTKELASLRHETVKFTNAFTWGNYKLMPFDMQYAYSCSVPSERYPEELCKWYYQKTGHVLNLASPKTYNEKIQWLKLYDSTPLKTQLTDKYLVREWIKEKIGDEYLVPLLGVWDNFDEINFDKLPDRFVLKANHGCGWNIIVKDKSSFDRMDAKKKFETWMQKNYAFQYGYELQYMNIKPRIIAEAYLENREEDLYDYKVFCFNGKAQSVMYLCERKQGLKMAFYDLDWNKLPFVYTYPMNQEPVQRPENLEQLIALSEKLAEGFAHVRVDFYILNDSSFKFGEMTFTSCSGVSAWNPPEWDLKLGNMLQLPSANPIPRKANEIVPFSSGN